MGRVRGDYIVVNNDVSLNETLFDGGLMEESERRWSIMSI